MGMAGLPNWDSYISVDGVVGLPNWVAYIKADGNG